MYGLNSSECD